MNTGFAKVKCSDCGRKLEVVKGYPTAEQDFIYEVKPCSECIRVAIVAGDREVASYGEDVSDG